MARNLADVRTNEVMTMSRVNPRELKRGLKLAMISAAVATAALTGGPAQAAGPGQGGLSDAQAATERSAILYVFQSTMIAFDNGQSKYFIDSFADNGVFEVVPVDPARHVKRTKQEMAATGEGS